MGAIAAVADADGGWVAANVGGGWVVAADADGSWVTAEADGVWMAADAGGGWVIPAGAVGVAAELPHAVRISAANATIATRFVHAMPEPPMR